MIQRFVLIIRFRALGEITWCDICQVVIQNFFWPERKLRRLMRNSFFFAPFYPKKFIMRFCFVLLNALDGKANVMKCRSTLQ